MPITRLPLLRSMASSLSPLFAPPLLLSRSVFLPSRLASSSSLAWRQSPRVVPLRRTLTVQANPQTPIIVCATNNGVVSDNPTIQENSPSFVLVDDDDTQVPASVNLSASHFDNDGFVSAVDVAEEPPAPKEEKDTDESELGPALSEFRLSKATVERLEKNGITHPTEVQAGTFDLLYDGKDIIAKSRTGTGKTLAFALPIVERIAQMKNESNVKTRGPRCLVLAPTRELAKQVAKEMDYIGQGLGLRTTCVYGGASYTSQENAFRRGVDVVVGTPGRIMDHLNRGNLILSDVRFAVLDEADEMLSMGFSQDVETVFETLPPKEERQVILFSATVPKWVRNLAAQYQKEKVVTFDSVTTGSMAATTVDHCAVRVPDRDEARAALLADIIAVYSQRSKKKNEKSAIANVDPNDINANRPRVIVFTETKREADELATSGVLDGCGAAVLHGDVTQRQREITLAQFRKGLFQVLVATDVAARGLDISGVEVVIQYRVPQDAESYIHRAGRTGRAGRSGTAVILYSDRDTRALSQLSRECRVEFSQEVAPAPQTALEAAVQGMIATTDFVDKDVIEQLLPTAKDLLQNVENSPDMVEEKLAGLLAVAARRTRLEDRSVLTGENGMKTMRVWMDENDVNRGREVVPGLVVRLVSELSQKANLDEKVGLIRMCKDGSAVFDVPSDNADVLLEGIVTFEHKTGLHMEIAKGVPALKDMAPRRDRSRNPRGSRPGGMRGRYNDRERGGYDNRRRYNSSYGSRRDGYERSGGRRYDNERSGGRRNDFDRSSSGRRNDFDRGSYGRRNDNYGGGYSSRNNSRDGGNRRSADFISDDF